MTIKGGRKLIDTTLPRRRTLRDHGIADSTTGGCHATYCMRPATKIVRIRGSRRVKWTSGIGYCDEHTSTVVEGLEQRSPGIEIRVDWL